MGTKLLIYIILAFIASYVLANIMACVIAGQKIDKKQILEEITVSLLALLAAVIVHLIWNM